MSGWGETIASGTTTGSSVSYPAGDPADGVGTWTSSAPDIYEWGWQELIRQQVGWRPYSREIVNEVVASFGATLHYSPPGDSFTNGPVTGSHQWGTGMENRLYGTGDTVLNATLSLDSGLTFDHFGRENLTGEGPPLYEWSFGNLPVGARAGTYVAFETSDPSPVTFTPGFDASRSLDITRFSAPGTQTLTIKVTPQESLPVIAIGVNTPEDPAVSAVITSHTGGDGSQLSPDGHNLHIWQNDPVVGTEYTYTVTIQVTPNVPRVELWPFVRVGDGPGPTPIYPAGTGGSFTHTVPGLGTWTWSTEGVYAWGVVEWVSRAVSWKPHVRELVNQVTALFNTFWIYVSPEDTFYNGEVTGGVSWQTQILNIQDDTGEAVTNVGLSLASSLSFGRVVPDPVNTGPPIEWSFGDVAEGETYGAAVGFMPPDAVKFTPGFDASRSFDRTTFSEPDTQTLTIAVTPRQAGMGVLVVDVFAKKDDKVTPVITSHSGSDFAYVHRAGRHVLLGVRDPVSGTEYTFTVTTQVTPKVAQVEFVPSVRVYTPTFGAPVVTTGSSVSYPAGDPADGIGTWTWSAEGSYQWISLAGTARAVVFAPRSRAIIEEFSIEHMSVDFDYRPDSDKIAITEATILLGDAAAYDLSADNVIVNIDGVAITIPAGSFVKDEDKEEYTYVSAGGGGPKVHMKLDFGKGTWRLRVNKINATAIDNSDGVDITLSIGSMLALERIYMRVGGLTYIVEQ